MLANLTNLTGLNLWDNNISDISVLANLTNLISLGLSQNSISDISVLSNLTNLEILYLWGNSISDISVLSNLTNLTKLYLDRNSISSISPLSNLTNLTYLYLSQNSISDISVLSNLTNLTELNIRNNNISDISSLVANTGLGSGDTVNLKSNPLSSTSRNTHIPTLQRRGVTVEFDSSSPDLIVESPSVSDNTLTTGQSFTLSVTVRNQGTGPSANALLEYYRSMDATITSSDSLVWLAVVSNLLAGSTITESIIFSAPSSTGTYYYGACVAAVTGESDRNNNCSTSVHITVSSSPSSPPPEPTNVTYQRISSSEYLISWDPSPGATYYEVYYHGVTLGNPSLDNSKRIDEVTETTYKHEPQANRVAYWVKACNGAGCSDPVPAGEQ